jgi:hypothetical protein
MRRRESSAGKSTVIVVVVIFVVVIVSGVAIAATFSLTSAHLGAGQVTTPVLFPDSIAITNGGGPGHNVGRPDAADKITVVYSEVLAKTNFCTGWTGTGNPTLDVDGNKAAGATGNDTMTLDQSTLNMTCTGGLHFGSVDLGGTGYFTSATAVDFNKSTVTLTSSATQSTLVITLGTIKAGTVGTVSTNKVATYTPDSALSDGSGHSVGANKAASPAEVQF